MYRLLYTVRSRVFLTPALNKIVMEKSVDDKECVEQDQVVFDQVPGHAAQWPIHSVSKPANY